MCVVYDLTRDDSLDRVCEQHMLLLVIDCTPPELLVINPFCAGSGLLVASDQTVQ